LAGGYNLESSSEISGGWSAVTNAISISGEQNLVTIGPSGMTAFFRLKK
jgi:hypothetical protein